MYLRIKKESYAAGSEKEFSASWILQPFELKSKFRLRES